MDGPFIVFPRTGVPLVFGALSVPHSEDVPAGDLGSSLLRSGCWSALRRFAFTICRDGYGLFARAMMLMAGGAACFEAAAGWLRVGRGRGEEPPWDWRNAEQSAVLFLTSAPSHDA